MRTRTKPKVFISLNEAATINPDMYGIFSNVELFDLGGDEARKLFKMLKYECGDRYINYDFPVSHGAVIVDDEQIEDIQTFVDLFTLKWTKKYLALLESEDFEYNPLDNTDIKEERDITRTPQLSESETLTGTGSKTTTLNNSDTKTINTTKTYNNLKDKTDYGKGTSGSDRTDYHSTTTTDDDTTYGKVDTNVTTNNATTNAVVPYDQVSTFFDADKSTNNPTETDTLSGKDQRDISEARTGYDTVTKSETLSGSDSTTRTGNIADGGTVTDAHSGTISDQLTNGHTKTTSQNGKETTDDDMTRTGFQPQYSISSRQDMIRKFREVSDFSTLDTYLKEVANYILLGTYVNF